MADETSIGFSGHYRALTVYAFVVAFLYQVGYWELFEVPIFEYASFSDILRFAAWPLVLTVTATLLGAAMPNVLYVIGREPRRKTDWPRISVKGYIAILIAVAVACVWAGRVNAIFEPFLTDCLLILMTWPMFRASVSRSKIPITLRGSSLFFAWSLPFLANGVGGVHAQMILHGEDYRLVKLPHSVVLRAGIDDDDELRLLGRTDSYVLFWMPKVSRVLVVADSDVSAMQIEPDRYRIERLNAAAKH